MPPAPSLLWFREDSRRSKNPALRDLERFLAESFANYGENRNRPDRLGTPRLSLHRHFGDIGPRQLWHVPRAHAEQSGCPPLGGVRGCIGLALVKALLGVALALGSLHFALAAESPSQERVAKLLDRVKSVSLLNVFKTDVARSHACSELGLTVADLARINTWEIPEELSRAIGKTATGRDNVLVYALIHPANLDDDVVKHVRIDGRGLTFAETRAFAAALEQRLFRNGTETSAIIIHPEDATARGEDDASIRQLLLKGDYDLVDDSSILHELKHYKLFAGNLSPPYQSKEDHDKEERMCAAFQMLFLVQQGFTKEKIIRGLTCSLGLPEKTAKKRMRRMRWHIKYLEDVWKENVETQTEKPAPSR